MKWFSFLLLVLSALSCHPTQADELRWVEEARAVAEKWLGASDAGDFSSTWEQASPALKQAVEKKKWEGALQSVRTPLGTLKSRKLINTVYKAPTQGSAGSPYVVITYVSSFANRATAVETVTPMRGDDGVWRVSGYFIE